MTTPSPLSLLPAQIADISAAIAVGGYQVTRASAARWFLQDDAPDAAYLTNIRVGLRVSFTLQTSSTIFFFFHTDAESYVPVEASVAFQVRPIAVPPAPPGSTIPRCRALPPFVLTGLSAGDIARFGPSGATPQNTVFLALGNGQDIFALRNPRDAKRSAIRFSRNRTPGVEQTWRSGYDLQPFLELMKTLDSWVADGAPAAAPVPMSGSAMPVVVTGILDTLTEAYVTSASQLAAPTEPLASAQEWFSKYYEIYGFSASVKMRITADGSLSESPEQERLQIATQMKIDGTHPVSTITIGEPRFVVAGRLRQAFLDELAYDPACTGQLAELLGVVDIQISSYIDTTRETAIVVLAQTSGSSERALIWLPGQVAGVARPLLLSGLFTVKTDEPQLSVSPHGNISNAADPLDNDDARSFLELVSTIQLWVRLLE